MFSEMGTNFSLTSLSINSRLVRLAQSGPERGTPLLCLHGWPELWYSWRHQLAHFSAQGYRVIAPDMPGFGGSEPWPSVTDYNIVHLAEHVVAILDELKIERAILMGHDWGAAIAWHTAQLFPQRFSHLVVMSVPLLRRFCLPATAYYREKFGEDFFYQLYFQESDLPEAEFDRDPGKIIRRLYCSPSTPRHPPELLDKCASAGGWVDRLGEPKERPAWLRAEDLDYIVGEYAKTGFGPGIHYYRNIDVNHELLREYPEEITLPTLFIAGEKDSVLHKLSAAELRQRMLPRVPKLQLQLIPTMGHWIQQEAPAICNKRIEKFLAGS